MKSLFALTIIALMFTFAQNTTTPQSSAAEENAITYLTTEDIHILERIGETQYYWLFEGDDCVLYASDLNGENPKKLATFPPNDREDRNEIVTFALCGDWLIASVGNYQGSGHYFYGDFVRLKEDGSELEHFWLTDADTFITTDEWIYYNFWTVKGDQEGAEGVYRIRPDGSVQEYMGDVLQSVFAQSSDSGYLYGTRNAEDWAIDLIRFQPDNSESVILFSGETLPFCPDSTHMQYSDFEIHDTSITFTVSVLGYRDGDSWRGHTDYTADYRIDKEGSHLMLLQEKYPVSHAMPLS